MRVVMFYHSLVSDWSHGHAHVLRGVAEELLNRSAEVRIFEPADAWSRTNLVADHGIQALDAFSRAYPRLRSELYTLDALDLDAICRHADIVIVHEWNDPRLVAMLGAHRRTHPTYLLFFHDTHHRSLTKPKVMAAYDLRYFDGVLAFGDSIRDLYLDRAWTARAWTWHEAADTRVFRPRNGERQGDLVWIGNWGDDDRAADLEEFLLKPVRRLGLRAAAYGVRYPADAIRRLEASGIEYRGWLANYDVPRVFSQYSVTVHIPRAPYLQSLAGVPTIRPFEALACGIPLISARWDQTGGLFAAGSDFLVAHDSDEMTAHLAALLAAPAQRRSLAVRGLATIRDRHTCAHRVDELMHICDEATRMVHAS